MFEDLGISAGTAIIVLIALYFIIKWAVKNGMKEAFYDIQELKDLNEKLEKHSEKED